MIQKNKEDFLRIYSNLPLKVREEIILDLGEDKGGPITWNAAYIEVKNETALSKEILVKLKDLKII